jgi:hypothetical protein
MLSKEQEERIYYCPCEGCKESFRYKQNRREHILQKHKYEKEWYELKQKEKKYGRRI